MVMGMDRRVFLKIMGAGIAGAILGPVTHGGRGRRKPNIVLIFIDDMGWKDAGYAGSDLYETPNIDRLAKEGVVFTNAYACAGNCAPSRACLLSGQYTPRHGVYAVGNTKRGPVNHMRLEPIPNNTVLSADNVTVAEAMRAAGYATGMFGKWHLGTTDEVLPAGQGFDIDENCSPPSNKKFKQTNDPKSIYQITEGACRFMEQNRDRPFFAYVSHHATHMGIQARQAMYDKFAGKGEGKIHSHEQYAAMNAQMDDGVGILLDRIKVLGLERETLVVFTSDNGGLPQSSQAPLRGFKGLYYEGGIRVPLIARWVGVTLAGTSCDVPVHNVDLYPTFLDAAGSEAPRGKVLDGESLLRLLKREEGLRREAIFWHFPGYLDRANSGSRDQLFRTRPVTVIRKGDWKLHLYHEEWVLDGGRAKVDTNKAVELYNLREDISERNDLASTRKDKRDELLDDLLTWMVRTGAKMPSQANVQYNPTKATERKKKRKAKQKS